MKKSITIDELFFYLMIVFFMGAKAIGLNEGQWPFSLTLILGFLMALIKLLISKNSVIEWIIILGLYGIGGYIAYNNGHVEALVNVAMLIGIKNISLKRTMKISMYLIGILFVFTVIRALFGVYPGMISWQTKIGMDYGVLRYSLGFTHPNVLHITFFVLASLIVYNSSLKGKNRLLLNLGLMILNIYFFIYSVSYTGFIVVTFLILSDIFFSYLDKLKKIEMSLIVITAFCFVFPLFGQSMLPEKIAKIANLLINYRLQMSSEVFSAISPSLFGSNVEVSTLGYNLDSSYSYAVHYHGVVLFSAFVILYLATMFSSLRKDHRREFIILFIMAVSGITEQYMANLSCKNISIFFMGSYLFNELFHNKVFDNESKYSVVSISQRNISFEWANNIVNKVKWYFKGTKFYRCIFPAIIVGTLAGVIYVNFWNVPKHIYFIASEPTESSSHIIYSADSAETLEINESVIIGDLHEGDELVRFDWINPTIEFYRGIISSIFWGSIFGFILFSFLLNLRKLNIVCIETPILDDKYVINDMPSCSILGTNIAVTNMRNSVEYITSNLKNLSGKYICVSNVHTTVMASIDEKYRCIQNGAVIALPDGKPLSYVSRMRGYLQADRVAGPDLMAEIFAISADSGYKHFFFGSSEETLKKLKENLSIRYPGIDIVGMLSPDYYKKIEDIPVEDNEKYIENINASNADFIWVGLGAPKQEQWMALNEGKVHGVMIGVGAGFDFHAGTIKRAPKLMQGLYLEWLYRLFQDPKRLFKRYISTNFRFIREVAVENRKIKKGTSMTDKPKLLIYAHYYYPDVASTGQILTELSEGLSSSFDVTVIAVVPSYNGTIDDKYKIYRYYQQNVRGVQVVRVRVPEFAKTNKLSRVWNIVGYYFRARSVTNKIGHQDIVFSISQPPILGGILGVYGKKRKKSKFVYNIQDFNPEQIQSVRYSNNKLLIWLLKKMDMRTCSKSDLIITVGCDLGKTIQNRFFNKSIPDYVVINNWINEEEIYPINQSDAELNNFLVKYGLKDKFVFMYSGNLGLYYDLPALFEIICSLPKQMKTSDGREIVFAFVGNGSIRSKLEKIVKDHSTENVIFIPYQDKEKLIYSLNAGDVHICMNAKGIKGVSCPSKYYGIAAVGKPVLASLEKDTEIRNIIEMTHSGLVSSPGDDEQLANNILKFIHEISSEELYEMGKRGRNNLLNNLTKKDSIDKYRKELLALLR